MVPDVTMPTPGEIWHMQQGAQQAQIAGEEQLQVALLLLLGDEAFLGIAGGDVQQGSER